MKIKVIAPSSKPLDIDNFLQIARENLSKEGVELCFENNIFSNDSLPFFASTKEFMIQDLKNAISSDEYEIIWAARGGYGSANLAINLLDIKVNPAKTIIGFSDITALHSLFNNIYKLPTIHADVISNFIKKTSEFSKYLKPILEGDNIEYNITSLNNLDYNIEAQSVTGGNLTVLCSLIGTKICPDLNEKILFIEDVNEPGYKIHRNLMHLKNSGVLDYAKAIIFGDFTESDNFKDTAINDFVNNEINIPCFSLIGAGHAHENKPIIFGSKSKIENSVFKIHSPFKYKI